MASQISQISQKELAERLGLTARQIHNLAEQGLPRAVKAGRATYPWPAALKWYIEWKSEAEARRAPVSDLEELQRRKLAAEAQLKEIEVARMAGELIPLALHEERLGFVLDRLRAKLLNLPAKWSPALVGCRTIPEALSRLEPAVAEAMQALSDTADDIEAETASQEAA